MEVLSEWTSRLLASFLRILLYAKTEMKFWPLFVQEVLKNISLWIRRHRVQTLFLRPGGEIRKTCDPISLQWLTTGFTMAALSLDFFQPKEAAYEEVMLTNVLVSLILFYVRHLSRVNLQMTTRALSMQYYTVKTPTLRWQKSHLIGNYGLVFSETTTHI